MDTSGEMREWRTEIERPVLVVPQPDPKVRLRDSLLWSVVLGVATVYFWRTDEDPPLVLAMLFAISLLSLVDELLARYRRKRRHEPPPPKYYEQILTIDPTSLRVENRDNGKTEWLSKGRVALVDLWGVKDTGDRIRVISKPMYQTAFEFRSSCFRDEADKREFFAIIESLGGKVIPDRSQRTEPGGAAV